MTVFPLRGFVVIAAFLLAACGTTQMRPAPVAPVDVQRSTVIVHEPCRAKEKLGPEPEYAATDDALRAVPFPLAVSDEEWLANWFYQTKLLAADRRQRIKRDQEKTAIIEGC